MKLGIVFTAPPFGNARGQDALDVALAAGSFGQDVALFFTGAGVLQLVKGQSPDCIGAKNYTKTFAALPFYDVEDIYVCQTSLEAYGIASYELCVPAVALSAEDMRQHVDNTTHLLTF
ncbi:sulfurtransferase complex subunit TusC [Aestuariibacter halophilus]|uniref:Sulfurtransferase complex subunit TusC n=1 Tax=Fluctibacter halophilus TaxID=226011 RepID=A0ABS8G969_9ALTE|nr:sulfurtransferase complex subunit TusC [Aestuariibacter halophilus]MCC2615751.1 sulfurtransferase complex subunit TusC [Aestuariibacter halophilus]